MATPVSSEQRATDEWASMAARIPTRSPYQEAPPHLYMEPASWRAAPDQGSTLHTYPNLTSAYHPPSPQLMPESRPSPSYNHHPEMYTHHQVTFAQDLRYLPISAPQPQLSDPSTHDARYSYNSTGLMYPTQQYSHSTNTQSYPNAVIPSEPLIAPSTTTITLESAPEGHVHQQHHAYEHQTHQGGPGPFHSSQPQSTESVDFERVLRSYEHVLGSLPPADSWSDDRARQSWSSSSLGELVSSAVVGLQSLDPNARFSPSRESDQKPSNSASPETSSADQLPIIRTKRRRAIQKCLSCESTSTPEWRKGPMGPRTLCNACGLVWAKVLRKRAMEEKAKERGQPGSASVSISHGTHTSPLVSRRRIAQTLPP